MPVRTIFFVGKPGCGKDTQAALLAEKTGWHVVSAGDQFRAIAEEDSVLGRKIKKAINSGVLAPDWVALHLYLNALFTTPEEGGVIFDGFCRERSQAKLIHKSLTWLERPYVVLYIRVSDASVRQRLALRAQKAGRADDSVVEERLKEFYEQTEPAIEYFKSLGTLIEIDGEPLPEVIGENVRAKLAVA